MVTRPGWCQSCAATCPRRIRRRIVGKAELSTLPVYPIGLVPPLSIIKFIGIIDNGAEVAKRTSYSPEYTKSGDRGAGRIPFGVGRLRQSHGDAGIYLKRSLHLLVY